jgi:molybdopterin-containing oxidoreductase family iron-sulfur binding subunit
MSAQWRSLQQLADDPFFRARVAQEFPALAASLSAPRDRRSALKLMSAALAMAGLSGCDLGAPEGVLIPAVRAPAEIIPGLPNFYSTANLLQGFATGVVVKHHMGRPIKVEGNPQHPASLGATDVFAQAEVLNFYDPERSFGVTLKGDPISRAAFQAALAREKEAITASRGAGFCILTGAISSPTLIAQIKALLNAYPEARWRQFEPVSRGNVAKGSSLAYGRPLDALFKLDAADVILAIDSDLLSSAPGHLRYARDFASRRNPTRTAKMSRVYAVEPTPTLIGAAADHRFIAGPRDLPRIFAALADAVLRNGRSSDAPAWVSPLASDLIANRGRALIHLGPDHPPEMHALVHAMNEALGARGETFDLIEPVVADFSDEIDQLTVDMRAGRVNTLLIIDSNPIYAAPPGLGFHEALQKMKFSLALTQTPNETSDACLWSVPLTHVWESWGDARAYDGSTTILQPQALPLYGGLDAFEMLGKFDTASPTDALRRVKATWRSQLKGDFPQAWQDALANGVLPNTASKEAKTNLNPQAAAVSIPQPADRVSLLTRPDPNLWDGRFAANAWLQEVPRPFTKLTWDNPLLVAPGLGRRLGLENGDVVRVARGEAATSAAVWIMPGQAEDCLVAHLGGGRKHAGPVGAGAGFDFYPLVGAQGEISLRKTGSRATLASTEHHNAIFDGSGVYAKHATLDEYQSNDRLFASNRSSRDTLYRWKPEGPAAWGMSVDLNACIGCNACVVACQAENNVPTVGKDEVLHEREMHWLRIDRYYEGEADDPDIYLQPTLCMHCEQAPCETVCPVGATVHDSEGLNVMVYNRCIGTRFCSNNCPYKVRRFNYFSFTQKERRAPQSRNPEVTVRARGVMEKCTFCLQRIAEARIVADRDNQPIGDVVTACQAACPTKVFTFGNLAKEDSEVVRRKQSPLDYALLADQNTHPRVTYEARISNRNPAIRGEGT